MEKRQHWLKPAIIAGLATLAVALAGGAATTMGPWYDALTKPELQPPGWVFGPAWTTIYILTAISATLAWVATEAGAARRNLLLLFIANGILNAAWTPLFFALQQPALALVDIGLLWLTIAALIAIIWPRRKLAAVLLFPYLAWVSFATYLNASIVALN
ncbi:TspO/MBR family protein [Minwuia sp.]|uniref:TspO/MBR family protein n=1 Tax=Minwuia sp. TaxID=2493630 RepID=UPI003A8D927E